MSIRIGITGAAGRMGRTLIEAISQVEGLALAAAIERPESTLLGADAGELCGMGKNGVTVVGSLASVISDIDVLIDFSVPVATLDNLAHCVQNHVAIVIGTLVTLFAGILAGALLAGFEWLSVLGAILAAGELFIGGILGLALTHFAIFKPRATEFEP